MSWKKYGGTNKLDRMNNMNVNNLTTDAFSLQNPYQGDFDICGNLRVDNIFATQMETTGNLAVNGALLAAQLKVESLVVDTNSLIIGDLSVVGQLVFDSSGSSIMTSDGHQHVGLNTNNPTATFDICGNSVSSLNVFSTLDYTRNVIAQNVNHRGIAVETDSSSSSITFYNDAAINPNTNAYSARLQYTKPGTFTLDVDDTTNLLSKVVVSNRTDISNILNGSLVVYDVSAGIYQQSIYKNPTATTGESLTMIANDVSATTMMHMITPNKKGLAVAAGAYPKDQTRSMTTLGWMDTTGASNVYPEIIPSQMIVSGNNRSKHMSTVGINTYAPRTDNYVLDINGPIHVANGQLRVAQTAGFEIKQISRTMSFATNIIGVGSPSRITSPYTQNVYYSRDGGQSWTLSNIDPVPNTSVATVPITFNGIYTYDNSFSVMAGQGGYMFYTVDAGATWYQLSILLSVAFNAVYVDASYVNLISNSTMYYFANPYPGPLTMPPLGPRIIDIGEGADIDISSVPLNGLFTNANPATCVCGNDTNIFIAGVNYVLRQNKSTRQYTNAHSTSATLYCIRCNGSNIIAVGNGVIAISTDNGDMWTNHNVPYVLRSLFIFDDKRAIACGDGGILIYTEDGYATWTLLPSDILRVSGNEGIIADASNNFVSIHMSDPDTVVITATRRTYQSGVRTGSSYLYYCYLPALFNRAFNHVMDVCGNMRVSGDITVDDNFTVSGNSQLATMSITPYNVDILGNLLADNLEVRGNVSMANLSVGNIVVVSTIFDEITVNGTSSFAGISTISNITNSTSTSTGALVVAGGVGIKANVYVGDTLFSKNVKGNVITGNTVQGNVVQGNLISGNTVQGNIVQGNTVQGNLISGNIVQGNTMFVLDAIASLSTTTGAFQVAGGAGISGNLFVGYGAPSTSTSTGTLVITGGIGVSGNAHIGEHMVLHSSSGATSTTTGALQILNGMGIGGNAYVGGELVVANTTASLSTTTGALQVAGGAGISGNLYVGYGTESSSSTTGTLVITGGVGINSNVYVGGNLNVNTNTILIGNTNITNTTESSSKTTGAFVVSGGAGIGANLSIGGNVNVDASGTVYIYNTNYGRTHGEGALIITGGASVGGNLNVKGNVNVGANIIVQGLVAFAGDTYITEDTESSSTSSGSLIIVGGVGIGANIFVGGNSTVYGNSRVYGNAMVYSTTGSRSATTGALQISGGAGIQGNTYVGGQLVAANITNSSSTSTGSMLVSGGVGISGNIHMGGILNVSNTSNSNSGTTGALIVSGGIGVQANAYVAGNVMVGANVRIHPSQPPNASTDTYDGLLLTPSNLAGGVINELNRLVSIGINAAPFGTRDTTKPGSIVRMDTRTANNVFSVNTYRTGATDASLALNIAEDGTTYINAGLGSTNTTSGVLRVNGGVGITGNTYIGGQTVIRNISGSLSATTGALLVDGGVGIGGNIFVNQMIRTANNVHNKQAVLWDGNDADAPSTATNFCGFGVNSGGATLRYQVPLDTHVHRFYSGTSDGILVAGNLLLNNNNASTNTNTGALRIVGGAGIGGNAYIGGQTMVVNNTASLDSATTGALQITGGVGVGGNIYINDQIRMRTNNNINKKLVLHDGNFSENITTGTTFYGFGINTNELRYFTLSTGVHKFYSGANDGAIVAGGLSLLNTTATTNTATTGALIVSGGAGINGNIFVNSMIRMHNSFHNKKLVLFDASINEPVLNATRFTGFGVSGDLLRYQTDATTGVHRFYSGSNDGAIVAGGLSLLNTTATTNTATTGALIVSGGVGINGNIFANSVIRMHNSFQNKKLVLFDANINEDVSNATQFTGFGVSGDLLRYQTNATTGVHRFYSGTNDGNLLAGTMKLTSTTNSTSTSTGALQLMGGVGVGGQITAQSYMGKIDVNDISAANTENFLLFGDTYGLEFKLYAGYFNNDVNYFTNGSTLPYYVRGLSSGNAYIFENIITATNALLSSADTSQVSIEWFGVFIPPDVAGGFYAFELVSDDICKMWTGNNALPGNFNVNNTTITIPSIGGTANNELSPVYGTPSAPIPIRIQYGNNGGAMNISLRFKETSLYGYVYSIPGKNVFMPYNANPKFTPFSHRYLSYNPGKQSLTSGNILINSGASSLSTTTGALTVLGGAGISKNMMVGGTVDISGITSFKSNVQFYDTATPFTNRSVMYKAGNDLIVDGIDNNSRLVINNKNSGVSYTNASFSTATTQLNTSEFLVRPVVAGSTSAGFRMSYDVSICYFQTGYIVDNTAAPLRFTNPGNTTAALGIDESRRITIGTNTATTGSILTVASGGNVSILSTTDATNSTSGALQVSGGVSITGNLFANSLIRTRNTTDNKKIVLYDNGTSDAVASATNFYGFGVNASTLRYQATTSAIHSFYSGTSDGALNAGSLYLTGTTASASTTTGALRVAGGVGIGGNLYVGGGLNAATLSLATAIFDSGFLQGTSSIVQMLSTGKKIAFYGNLSNDSYNTMVDASDSAIIAGVASNDGAVLYLGTYSTTSSGIRITNSTVFINPSLTVSGQVTATSFNAQSDYRIKSNVVSLYNTDYSTDKLKPVYYYNTVSKTNDIGFIAHEVQEHYPFLVSGEKDGETNQSLNYLGIIGILVKEVQNLKKNNEEMRREIDELREMVLSMKTP